MLSKKTRFWFPLSIITLLVISFMSNDLFIPSMPELTSYFGVSANSIQNSIAFWFYGAMSLQLILGPISDRYGRKPIVLFSTGVLIVASVFCAFSPTMVIFLLARFFQGVGVSGIMVAGFAALHEVYEKENNGTKILGYVGSCTALSPLAGPLIGGYIASYFGWAMNFHVVSVMGILLIGFIFKYMPETVTTAKAPQWCEFGKGYQQLLLNTIFTTTVGCYGLLFFAGGAFLAVVPFIVIDLLHFPIEYVGYAMMPMFICYMFTSSLAARLEQKVSTNRLVGFSLGILSLLMFAFIIFSDRYESNVLFILLGMATYYLGLGLIGPPLNNISLSQASSENKGSASALLTVTMMLGSALGASGMSYFYNGHLFPIAMVMGGSIIAAFFLYLIYRAASTVESLDKQGA